MNKKFFASSNSYHGFHSLFGDIFKSEKFNKIFVIKGGPGTGKSSLIKSVAKFAEEIGGSADRYYCSSDTNSLDGCIIRIGEKSFAILDGTAPHQRDAVFPMVIDETINLAAGIETDWINEKKDEIIMLSSQKMNAYQAAYSYLRLAGECYKEIRRKKIEKFHRHSALKYIWKNFNECDTEDESITSKRFISSFSKDGYKMFWESHNKYDTSIKIGGDKICTEILLKLIAENIACKKIEILPSPLSPDSPEKIITNDKDLICASPDSYDVMSNNFFEISKTDSEEIRLIEKTHEAFLSEAARWLSIASDIHFRLEDIYKNAMNFDNNRIIFDKICKKILKVCDYSG